MTRARSIANIGAAVDSGLSWRNRLINGDMRIDQRNNGASVIVNPAAPFVVDRWNAYSDVANMNGQRSTVAPAGFVNSMVFTVTGGATPTAGQISRLEQRIEGLNVADLGWGTANAVPVTVSFWVRSSVTGPHSGVMANVSGNRSYPFTFTISAANTWEYKTITVPGDTTGTWATDNTTGLKLMFNLGSGSTYLGAAGAWGGSPFFGAIGSVQLCATGGATLYLTGVQLEAGSTVNPFERRDYGRELMMCQRYYQKYTGSNTGLTLFGRGYAVGTGQAFPVPFTFPVTMRSGPTVAFFGTWSVSNAYQPTAVDSSIATPGIYFSSVASADSYVYAGASAGFSATSEL